MIDAVILASGEGMRMRPLTQTTPKPLLTIAGAPILDHLLRALPQSVERVIVSVKYLGQQFKTRYGSSWGGREFVYVEGSLEGNALGFLAAQDLVRTDRLIICYGDDLPSKDDIARCLAADRSALCFETTEVKKHGMAVLREDGTIADILEKPEVLPSKLGINGCMVFDRAIFSCAPHKSAGELHFSSMVNEYVKKYPVTPVIATGLIYGISSPADLGRAEKQLLARYARV